ncbi:O-methyltransferase involved in polyketide biosynthesis [Nocardia sp. GAS34]|uniref:class I SAM-dependent methyltransferase n=1 Tax=unclassified Nocardia TaxID=2637762 RepID=UPI003D24324A
MTVQRTRLDLNQLEETLLITLWAKALDGKLPVPMLGDTRSAEIADRIDYDFGKLKIKDSLTYETALRSRKLDDTVRSFTAAHPDAVVLDLGCGLDPRMIRCRPTARIDWYDVDFPEVVALRPQFLPEPSHLVGADITDSGWLEGIPGDRPAMIVAEGLIPFLPGDAFQALTHALTTHFTSGEIALNGYTRFAAWAMKYHPTIKALGIKAAAGFDDPRIPETWDAGLTLVAEDFLTRAPEIAAWPEPLRALTRAMARSTALSRQGARILRYRF